LLPEPTLGSIPIGELMRRSRWPVLRRLGLHPGGDERSAFRGTGIEYSDVREYQAGDDPRSIEWNITARSDRPFVRESLPDRGLTAWLLVDVTRSLDWGTARCLKRQLGLELAAVAGQLLIARGNRVGAIVFDDWVRRIIAPSSGRAALLRLIAQLESAAASAGEGPSDLARPLNEAGRLIRRASLMIVISDFLGGAGWQRPLRSLAIRHEVIAAWIVDPREREIPDVGVVTFEDAENREQIVVDTGDARLRARFLAAAAEQRHSIRTDLQRARVGIAELSTERELVPQLVDFIKQRQALRGHPAAVRA
jgi:uncharacterized protein (DUF58 family)